MHRIAVIAVCAVLLSIIGSTVDTQAATFTKTVRYGPFTIPAATEAGPGTIDNELRFGVERPCLACHITSFTPDLVYSDGTSATLDDGAMMHHIVLSSLFRSDARCWNTWGERFFASGDERTPMSLPDGYGYPVELFDSWVLLAELMNHQARAQTVYVEVTYTYRPVWEPVKPVKPVWLDIDPCGDSEYAIPAGASDTHQDWFVTVPGAVVAAAGHVHGHGVAVEATNETSGGASICRSEATLHPSNSHRVLSMSTCVGKPLASIRWGNIVRLHSEYQSPTPQDDVMGIMLLYVHPD